MNTRFALVSSISLLVSLAAAVQAQNAPLPTDP